MNVDHESSLLVMSFSSPAGAASHRRSLPMNRSGRALGILAFLLAMAFWMPVHTAAQSSAASSIVRDVVLNPGDVIKISVWRKPELSGEFVVAADGTIAEPFYMDLAVVGVPFSVVQARVRAHVELYETSPRVLVEPLFRVAVGGEVRQPNVYSVRPETTVFQAVILAGGPTQQGERNTIRLLRDGRELELSLSAAHQEEVRSGDRIFVDRRYSAFREVVIPALTVAGAIASIVRVLQRF